MKPYSAILSFVLLAVQPALADIQTDWAFHAVGSESRLSELVPGEDFKFLANGTDQVNNSDTVTLYLLTADNFAGDMDEQIYVRWWDGAMSHWIMGCWVKNITLDASRPETRLRGLPTEGTVTLDLWKVEIPEWITQPGENFYAIQLKGFAQGTSEERYLLSKPGGDFSQTNNLGQVWSASEEFDGQDWKVNILQ
jgi:hypothetical protein